MAIKGLMKAQCHWHTLSVYNQNFKSYEKLIMKNITLALLAGMFIAGCHTLPPGHDPRGPGNSENAPGHNKHGDGPGNSENAPGHNKGY